MSALRILVVDDEKSVRYALAKLLGTKPGWQVVGEASDGLQAVMLAKDLKPDVVIMDISIPGLNGLQATPEIKKVAPGSEVLVFSQHDSPQMIEDARKAGASGYLVKSHANWLVAAVEAVGQHKPFFEGKNL